MPKGDAKIKPIVFYGVRYVSSAACMAINGIKSYAELSAHIEREKKGLPFVPLARRRNENEKGEMARRRYFERKLKAEGFIKERDND
jgi:hypothetical protein